MSRSMLEADLSGAGFSQGSWEQRKAASPPGHVLPTGSPVSCACAQRGRALAEAADFGCIRAAKERRGKNYFNFIFKPTVYHIS